MRPPVVVVCHVLAEHPDQVSLIDDYEVIEALSAQCASYPFGNRVRLWCSDGGQYDIDAEPGCSWVEAPSVAAVTLM
jgi:hypothetical protein